MDLYRHVRCAAFCSRRVAALPEPCQDAGRHPERADQDVPPHVRGPGRGRRRLQHGQGRCAKKPHSAAQRSPPLTVGLGAEAVEAARRTASQHIPRWRPLARAANGAGRRVSLRSCRLGRHRCGVFGRICGNGPAAAVPTSPPGAALCLRTGHLELTCVFVCFSSAWREKRAMADAYYRVQGVTPSHDSNRYLFTPTQRGMFK